MNSDGKKFRVLFTLIALHFHAVKLIKMLSFFQPTGETKLVLGVKVRGRLFLNVYT